jgi:hypothetical protein
MERRDFARHDGGGLAIDLCFPCHGIWFDAVESMQLAPAGVIDLFREIHRHEDGPRRQVAERLQCPHCRARLVLSYDIGKAGRFSYHRCPADHGRFTPFLQFLREKQFVRSLTPHEIARVRAELKQVRCSGCGAPIDLERGTACAFCKAPLAVLDADAVEKAMQVWAEAEARRTRRPSREAVTGALLDLRQLESKARRDGRRWSGDSGSFDGIEAGGDLLDACFNAVGEIFSAFDS